MRGRGGRLPAGARRREVRPALSREGLVDEDRLVVHPAALGDGLALFKDLPQRLALELVDARTYSTGAALHVYRPREG
jgi:dihydrofolate reductase